jgi:hypothetical protein
MNLEERASKLTAITAERDKLRDALEVYVSKGHHDTCSHALSTKYDCDCGYELGCTALKEKP